MDDDKRRIGIPPSMRASFPRLVTLIDGLNSADPAIRQATETVLRRQGSIIQPQLVSQATGSGHHVAFRMCMLDLLERIARPFNFEEWMELDSFRMTTGSKILKERIIRLLTAHQRQSHMEVPK